MSFLVKSNEEKIIDLLDYRASKSEQKIISSYLAALKSNNEKVISEFEKFGDSVTKIIRNKYCYQYHLKFGYSAINFNQYGWLESVKLFNIEKFVFHTKRGSAISNHISVGQTANDMWVYGMWWDSGCGGGASGLSIYGESFNTRKECILRAIEVFKNKFQRAASTTHVKSILNQAENLKKDISRVAVQLSLFV